MMFLLGQYSETGVKIRCDGPLACDSSVLP
jgi:hypothetical protein